MLPNDVTGGAIPRLAYSDIAIFIQRVDDGADPDELRRRVEARATKRRAARNPPVPWNGTDPVSIGHLPRAPLAVPFTDAESAIVRAVSRHVGEFHRGRRLDDDLIAEMCADCERGCREHGLAVGFVGRIDAAGSGVVLDAHRIVR